MSAKAEVSAVAAPDEHLPDAQPQSVQQAPHSDQQPGVVDELKEAFNVAAEVKMDVPTSSAAPADALPVPEVHQPQSVQEPLPPSEQLEMDVPTSSASPADALPVPEMPRPQDVQEPLPPLGDEAEPAGKQESVDETSKLAPAEVKADAPPTAASSSDALPAAEMPQSQDIQEVKMDVASSSAAPADAVPVPEAPQPLDVQEPLPSTDQQAKHADTAGALPQDVAPVLAPPVPPTAAAAVEEVPKQPSRKKARTAKPLAPLSASAENVPITTRRAARLKSEEPTKVTSVKGKQKQAKSTEPPTDQPADQDCSLEEHVSRYPTGHDIELK